MMFLNVIIVPLNVVSPHPLLLPPPHLLVIPLQLVLAGLHVHLIKYCLQRFKLNYHLHYQ